MSLQVLELNDARRSHDPTGTAALRRTWRSVAEIRLRQLRAQLRIAVVEQDLLGLGGGLAQYTPAHVRLKAMQDWFERTAATTMGGAWSTPYVASAWQSGHAGAMKETRKVATLYQFASEHLAQLAQAEFTGIAAALTQQVNRAAVEAVTFGDDGILANLAAGAVHVSSSTISVALAERLAAAHASPPARTRAVSGE